MGLSGISGHDSKKLPHPRSYQDFLKESHLFNYHTLRVHLHEALHGSLSDVMGLISIPVCEEKSPSLYFVNSKFEARMHCSVYVMYPE